MKLDHEKIALSVSKIMKEHKWDTHMSYRRDDGIWALVVADLGIGNNAANRKKIYCMWIQNRGSIKAISKVSIFGNQLI